MGVPGYGGKPDPAPVHTTVNGKPVTIHYTYVRFIDQPVFKAIMSSEFPKGGPEQIDNAGGWQKAVTQVHKHVKTYGWWPPGWAEFN